MGAQRSMAWEGNSKSAHKDPETYSSFGETSKLMILGVKAGSNEGQEINM